MADEGKNVVDEIQPDKDGKYPETVSWKQYVGVKESLGNKLTSEKQQVTSLKEQLGKAVNPEEFNRIKQELDDTKGKLTKTEEELTGVKSKSVSEKRDTLVKKGVPGDIVVNMSDIELSAALRVLEHSKPGPDMGGGGGAKPLEGMSPMALAASAYNAKK